MKIPVTVYSEITPNPSTMKFVANKYILPSGETANFTSKKKPLVILHWQKSFFNCLLLMVFLSLLILLQLPKRTMYHGILSPCSFEEFIRDWIAEAKEILLKSQENVEPSIPQVDMSNLNFEATEFDQKIASLLDEFVRPAVENDGGAIDYVEL